LLTSHTVMQRRRLGFELVLAIVLLMSSFARAGLAGAAVSCLLVCVSLRQYRVIVKGIAAGVVIAIVVVMFVPLPNEAPKWDGSQPISEMFLYKGKHEQGVLGSRQSVWNQTWLVISDHPWFGSGFGTSLTGEDLTQLPMAQAHIDSRVIREHGNSYLAIAEWVGLLGVVPFYLLVALTARNAGKVFSWLRQTGDVFSPAVPVAAVVAAGLVHAMFEDWMFAVGYYLCVFFWALAFILVDLLPAPAVVYAWESTAIPEPQYMAMASGQ
jgi:O-antigen ligase